MCSSKLLILNFTPKTVSEYNYNIFGFSVYKLIKKTGLFIYNVKY